MYRGHTVGVVVPAYNEEEFIGDVLETVPSFVDYVYAVDDGSTDGTWTEIRDHAERINGAPEEDNKPHVVPLRHETNRGVGGAIKTGYLEARADDVDVTVVMGGDGQMEPEMLDRLVDPIVEGRADYTKGNRFLHRTERENMPAFRFVGNAVLGTLTKVASGYWRSGDPQSGYTAISLRALERADVEGMYEYYGYCNDLLVKLNVADLRVMDVPRPITYGDEESHISYSSYIPRVSWMLLRNFLWRLKTKYVLFDFHPLVVAYAAGAVGTVGSLGALASAFLSSGGAALFRGGVALVGFALALVAFVGAMTLDAAANESLSLVEGGVTERDARPEPATASVATADGGDEPADTKDALGADPDHLDRVFDLLADRQRRTLLHELRTADGELTVEELAERVAASAEADDRETAATGLRHRHLPKLADCGVIDRDGDAVRYRGSPALDAFLERAASVDREQTVV